MELGIYTFAEHTNHPHIEDKLSPAQCLENLIKEIELVDEAAPTINKELNGK